MSRSRPQILEPTASVPRPPAPPFCRFFATPTLDAAFGPTAAYGPRPLRLPCARTHVLFTCWPSSQPNASARRDPVGSATTATGRIVRGPLIVLPSSLSPSSPNQRNGRGCGGGEAAGAAGSAYTAALPGSPAPPACPTAARDACKGAGGEVNGGCFCPLRGACPAGFQERPSIGRAKARHGSPPAIVSLPSPCAAQAAGASQKT